MADDFDEVRFPTDISYGSIGGPEFSTEVVQLGSGHEKRNQNWTYPRERWDVAYGVKEESLLNTLITFFYARKGRAIAFRFKNHGDYQGTNVEIGTGDGATDVFQLIKTYTSGGRTLTRKISKPVTNTVHVYIDSVEVSGWSVDTETGLITFSVPPSSGEVITADFEFDVPMRFDTDHLPVGLTTYQARSATVPLVEVRL